MRDSKTELINAIKKIKNGKKTLTSALSPRPAASAPPVAHTYDAKSCLSDTSFPARFV